MRKQKTNRKQREKSHGSYLKCDQCNKKLKSKLQLSRHKKFIHCIELKDPVSQFELDQERIEADAQQFRTYYGRRHLYRQCEMEFGMSVINKALGIENRYNICRHAHIYRILKYQIY